MAFTSLSSTWFAAIIYHVIFICVLLTLLRLGLLLLFSLGLITVIVVVIFDLVFITVVVAVVIINRIFDYLAHGLVS
jgi:hypothetical protein